MPGIDVQITDQAPTGFQVVLQTRTGDELALEREHPDVIEIEELAFGEVLSHEVRPLPAGAIRVRIPVVRRRRAARHTGGRPCGCAAHPGLTCRG